MMCRMVMILLLSGVATWDAGAEAAQRDDPGAIPQPSVNARSGVRWFRDVRYVEGEVRSSKAHRLDLYLPREDNWMDGRPLLIWIHGGGWVIGDKDDALGIYGRYCRKLAERGIAAANVNYRLSPPFRHPAQIEDIAAATTWLIARADEFGFDPGKLFLSGHSAGGHLAALLAVDDRWLKAHGVDPNAIAGVISSSGVYDVRPLLEEGRGPGFARWVFTNDTAADASPVVHLDRHDPPFLLICEEYGAYLRRQTDLMVEALQTAGVMHRRIDMPATNHISMLSDLLEEDGTHLTHTLQFVRERCGEK